VCKRRAVSAVTLMWRRALMAPDPASRPAHIRTWSWSIPLSSLTKLGPMNKTLNECGRDDAVMAEMAYSGCGVHIIGQGDIRLRLALRQPFQRLLSLVRCQLARTTEPHPTLLGALPALPRASANQLALELSQAPWTVSIKRPWGLVVSAHVSLSDLKPAPRSVRDWMTFRRWRVERCQAIEARQPVPAGE
jgi:hypothetical protein